MAKRKKKIVVKARNSEREKAKQIRRAQREVHGVFHRPTRAISPKKGKGAYRRAAEKRKWKREV